MLNIFSCWGFLRSHSHQQDLGDHRLVTCLPGPRCWPHISGPQPPSPARRGSPLTGRISWRSGGERYRRRGMDCVARTRCLHRSGRDVQEVLRARPSQSKRLRSGLCRMEALTSNTGLDPNRWDGEFQTVIGVTDSKPHILARSIPTLDPGEL